MADEVLTEPVFRLPPFTVEQVFTARSQSIDWGIKLLNIPPLWKETRGKGIKIGVLDTGISLVHGDLQGAILDAKDFTGSPTGPADDNGHGTACGSIIAARDNEVGIVGVANEGGLLVGKVLNSQGAGGSRSITSGIRWLVEKKADIISMSFGSPSPDASINQAVEEALAAGIICVCAAGNEGPDLSTVGYPAQVEGVVSVGAIDQTKAIARFSSRGKRVDIVAPGVNILVDIPPNNQAVMSGTSFACPYAAGVIALMLAKHRSIGGASPVGTPQQVIEHLHKTSLDLGPTGWDSSYGFGLISPEKLLAYQPPPGSVDFIPSDFSEAGLRKLRGVLGDVSSLTIRVH